MVLSPSLRKLALTTHVAVSVAFPGAVACFLVLAIAGLGDNGDIGRAAYPAMQWITSLVITPLCVTALVSGVVCSLGTPWGVVRYWWVVVKLIVTTISTVALVVHLRPIELMAETVPSAQTMQIQIQLVLASAAALLALIVSTALSVYKPRGLTRYGARQLAR
jgi:hypothetical protein